MSPDIPMGGRPLIQRSIEALSAAGIERVLIVTGHLKEHYQSFAARLGPWVTLAHNPDFATTGSLASLACAGAIDEPYLLVESDLLYEARAPRLLLEAPHPDLLLASGPTGPGDEVYVSATNGRLSDLTKRCGSGRPAGRRAVPVWTEVDDERHLARARTLIFPALTT
jgi:choline kinase